MGNTVLAQPEDAGLIRIGDADGDRHARGIALATDGNGRFTRLDPYHGAQLALAEAYRNVATTGARPLAVTNCLNFGSPEDPGVMWQFSHAVRGLADGCQALGVPVTGGNVSFYNQTGDTAILPTPVIGVLGVIDDVSTRIAHGFRTDGARIYLLGPDPRRARRVGSGRRSCTTTSAAARRRSTWCASGSWPACCVDAAKAGLLDSAHDVSDGGLAQTLVESCLARGVGATITLPAELDPFVALFSETSARVVVSVSPRSTRPSSSSCASARGLPPAAHRA